jgi:putative ABC transport system permease protein
MNEPKTAEVRRGAIEKQRQLPLGQVIEIAWRNIRVRLARSLLITSGIILALAFLTYVLCSDSIARAIQENAPGKVIDQLRKQGVVFTETSEDARIQTFWVAGLAVLVSFVGILNAMLLSVTERYGEIGTMKCLGALDRLIIELFLIESLFQGMVGTLLGIGIGVLLTLLEGFAQFGGVMWNYLPIQLILVQVFICFMVGTGLTVIGALYPAWHASRMQPIEAMRMQV